MDLWGLFYIAMLIGGVALVIALAFRPVKPATPKTGERKRDHAPAVLPLTPGDSGGSGGGGDSCGG